MVKTIHSLYIQDGGVKGSWPPPSLLKAQQICRRVSGSSCVLRDGERVLLHFRERNLFGLSISRQFANSCCSSHQTKGHFLITLQHLALLGPMSLLRNEVAPIIKKPSSHISHLTSLCFHQTFPPGDSVHSAPQPSLAFFVPIFLIPGWAQAGSENELMFLSLHGVEAK